MVRIVVMALSMTSIAASNRLIEPPTADQPMERPVRTVAMTEGAAPLNPTKLLTKMLAPSTLSTDPVFSENDTFNALAVELTRLRPW